MDESSGSRNGWKTSFVQRRRKSEGNVFLTWMFLNLISKQSAPQRAVCLRLDRHIPALSLSLPLPVNRATICGSSRGLTAHSCDFMEVCGISGLCWSHVTLAASALSTQFPFALSSFSQEPLWLLWCTFTFFPFLFLTTPYSTSVCPFLAASGLISIRCQCCMYFSTALR